MEVYIENIGVGLSIPGAMVLNWYRSSKVEDVPTPCDFTSLPADDKVRFVSKFIDCLYLTNYDCFKPTGCLYQVLFIMGTRLVMSYNDMKCDYDTSDLVVTKIEDAFYKATNEITFTKLKTWSTLIKAAFIGKKRYFFCR